MAQFKYLSQKIEFWQSGLLFAGFSRKAEPESDHRTLYDPDL
jgi:hypothetical protein